MNMLKYNSEICFREEDHVYFLKDNEDEKLISVTRLIEHYCPPFDSDFWSSYKAMEALYFDFKRTGTAKYMLATKVFNLKQLSELGISNEDFETEKKNILGQWADKTKKSQDKGTAYHLKQEELCRENPTKFLKQFQYRNKFVVGGDDIDMNIEYAVYPELILHRISDDRKLKIAGQSDLVIKKKNEITIIDYKTCEEIKKRGFYNKKNKKGTTKMLFPLGSLDDCKFNHYVMQLSTYGWMIEKRYPELKINGLFLKHVKPDGSEEILDVPYKKDHVKAMLNHFKTQIIPYLK